MPRTLFSLFLLFILAQNAHSQTDTVPPVLLCKQNLSFYLTPTCLVSVYASDLVDTVYDQSMPIELGIRKQCTGTGFPDKNNLYYSAGDLGLKHVEVWARDQAGNTSICPLNIIIGDFLGNCDPGMTLRFQTALDEGIDSVYFNVAGSNCLSDTFNSDYFAFNYGWPPALFQGYYTQFGSISPDPGYHVEIKPSKNINPLNGVTTYDLALISKHILGIEPLDSPYKIIAADANQDGKVTTFDILLLRKLILGSISELPNGKSWRFLPEDYLFPNPQNPFSSPFPEKIVIPNTADPVPSYFPFKGIKIGDVDFSADPIH